MTTTERNDNTDEPWNLYQNDEAPHDADAHEREQTEPPEARDWVGLAAWPLALFALGGLSNIGKGPHVTNTTWPDFFATLVFYVLLFHLPAFLAGVRFKQYRDGQRT